MSSKNLPCTALQHDRAWPSPTWDLLWTFVRFIRWAKFQVCGGQAHSPARLINLGQGNSQMKRNITRSIYKYGLEYFRMFGWVLLGLKKLICWNSCICILFISRNRFEIFAIFVRLTCLLERAVEVSLLLTCTFQSDNKLMTLDTVFYLVYCLVCLVIF